MPVPTLPNRDQYQEPAPQEPVKSSPETYRGSTVDSEAIPFNVLTTYISGQLWTVDWYSAVVGPGDSVQHFQEDLPPALQQYIVYRGMEMKVADPISDAQDGQTKDVTTQGSAKTYPIMVPKEGDFFLADIGQGQEGMFTVGRTNRLSRYATSPYESEYALYRVVDADLRKKIEAKVVEEKYYSRDFMTNGYQAFLHGDEKDLVRKLEEHKTRLMALYFNDFYSRDRRSLLVPNQQWVTYDPFIVKFMKNIIGTDEHPIMQHITEFNVSKDQSMYEFTLWNCIETMDIGLLPMCVNEVGILDVENFWSRPWYNSIYYSGCQAVIYPDMAQTGVDAGYSRENYQTPALNRVVRGRARFNELNRLIQSNTLNTNPLYETYDKMPKDAADGDLYFVGEASPAIRRVTVDNFYVFSEAFYNHYGDQPLSQLEALTLAALKGEAINIRTLEKLCQGAKFWDNVERFYYIPVLLALLRVYPRNIAS